jgi:hypothetical protein
VLHKLSLKRKKRKLRRVRGGLVDQGFDHLSLDPIRPALQCAGPSDVVQHVGGGSE